MLNFSYFFLIDLLIEYFSLRYCIITLKTYFPCTHMYIILLYDLQNGYTDFVQISCVCMNAEILTIIRARVTKF